MSGRRWPEASLVVEDKLDANEERTVVAIRRAPRVAAVKAIKNSEGSKLWSMSIDLNELKDKFDVDLVQNDNPLFVSAIHDKSVDVALTLSRTGAALFETCAKNWEQISREGMAKEWARDKTPPFDFEYTLREDQDDKNISETPFQYPPEWQQETVLELRETNVIDASETIEPILLDPKRQRYRLKKLSRRLSSQSDNPNRVFAHLLLFTHLLNRSQETLDDLCNKTVGFKDPKSAYADTICVLEDTDIFPHFKGDELDDVVRAAQTKALSAVDLHVESSFVYASQKMSDADMAKFSSEESLFAPRTCSKDEEDNESNDEPRMGKAHARKYLQAFFIAHNKNVDAFSALLTNEETASYTKYPTWAKDRYSARLLSDIRIGKAIEFRLMIEEEAEAIRRDLYHQKIMNTRKPVRSKKESVKAGIARLQSEIDTNNVAHVVKINASIIKRVAKFNKKVGMPVPDMEMLAGSKRSRRKLKYFNENGVPHNMKYGRWHLGKMHTFKGNINSSPEAGIPITPSKNAVKAKAALQYAFLSSSDSVRRYALENRSTLGDENEGCSVTFDFEEGSAMLKVQSGAATAEITLSLPPELRDSAEGMEMRWAYKGTKFYEEGLPDA